jgi:glycerol-3-phosphate dehydrogenase
MFYQSINEYVQELLDETTTADITTINEWVCMNGCDVHIVGASFAKNIANNAVSVVVYALDDADGERCSTMQDPMDTFTVEASPV